MSVSRWWKKKDTAVSSALSLALQGARGSSAVSGAFGEAARADAQSVYDRARRHSRVINSVVRRKFSV